MNDFNITLVLLCRVMKTAHQHPIGAMTLVALAKCVVAFFTL
jgi:hypothetical protein